MIKIGFKFFSIINFWNLVACLPPAANYQPDEQDLSIYGFGSMNTEKNIFPKNLLKGSLIYYPHNLCGYVKKRNNAENLFCAKGPSRACEVKNSEKIKLKITINQPNK